MFFWSLTPREYAALKRQWEERQKQVLYFHADLLAAIANGAMTFRLEPDRRWTMADFLPESLRPPKRIKTWQEQLAAFQGFTEARAAKTG